MHWVSNFISLTNYITILVIKINYFILAVLLRIKLFGNMLSKKLSKTRKSPVNATYTVVLKWRHFSQLEADTIHEINDFWTLSKGSYLFIRENLIRSGFYLRNCLLLAKFRFLARAANKTCLIYFGNLGMVQQDT